MKKVLFIGQIIPQDIYDLNTQICQKTTDGAGNVFYNALLHGLSENGIDITCRTSLPGSIDRELFNGRNDDIHWRVSTFENCFIVRVFKNFIMSFLDVIKWFHSATREDVVLFNFLRIGQSLGGLLACKLLRLKTVTVVTDVPGHRINKEHRSLVERITDRIGQWIVSSFGGYVFLSEAMREIISIGQKPSVIVEGIFDSSNLVPLCLRPDNPFIVMYAGSLYKKYGIMNLVEAIIGLESESVHLHVYGNGEAVAEIEAISIKHPNIQYKGVVSHDKIIKFEAEASLLVNPRPVDEEYVKYSFPSKNMEYIASGTPVLLTNIPSLPEEYKEYVNLIQDNKPSTIQSAIQRIFDAHLRGDLTFIKRAERARTFIVQEKCALKQARKLIDIVERIT